MPSHNLPTMTRIPTQPSWHRIIIVGVLLAWVVPRQQIPTSTTGSSSRPFCNALSPSPSPRQPSSSTSSSRYSFEQFQFAPNGVCIQPALFVCHPSHEEEEEEENGSRDNENGRSDHQKEKKMARQFTVRNVPGTGDCMFQAVVLASLTSSGLGGNDVLLRAIARDIRAVVAQVLARSPDDGTLVIDGRRLVRAKDLLRAASQREGLTPQAYLEQLQLEGRKGGLYGGGPELTVLSNVLRRPISIYEVAPSSSSSSDPTTATTKNEQECPIQCKGVFGDRFEDPCLTIPNSAVLSPGLQPGAYSWHLHILVVEIESTGEKHACVLLPQ